MNPWVAQPPEVGDPYVGDASINAQAQQLYASLTPEQLQLALVLALNGTARTAQVHHQDHDISQQPTSHYNSPASSRSTPNSGHVQPASRAVTPSPQGRKRSRAPKAGSSTKKRKPSVDNATSELHSPPEGKAKRPLNSWIAFRCYYCKIFNNSQQKDISGFLRQLWQSDPFKAKWSLLASAWSLIRDEVGKKEAPLDVFIELVVPFLEICPSEHYLEVLGWEIAMDDGNGLANFRRSSGFDPDRLVDAVNTPYSVIDVVKYAVAEGYVPESAISLLDTETASGQDTRNFATEYQNAPARSQNLFMDSSNVTLAQGTHDHLGFSGFQFPQQQAIQLMESGFSPSSFNTIEEYSDRTGTLDPTLYSMNTEYTEAGTRNNAPPQMVETNITTFSTARQQPRFKPFSPLGINTALANTILPWLKGWMKDYAKGLSGPLTPKTVTNKLGPFLTAENEVQSISPSTETNAAPTEPVANTDETDTSLSSISTFNDPTPAITVSTPVSIHANSATAALSSIDQADSTTTKQITQFLPPAGAISRPASALLSPINTSRAASIGQHWSPMPFSEGLGALLRTPTFSPSMLSPATRYALFGNGETGIFMFPDPGVLGGGFIEGEISERGRRVSSHETGKDVEMYGLEQNYAGDKVLDEDNFSSLERGDDLPGEDMEGK